MLTHLRTQLSGIVQASLDVYGPLSPVPVVSLDAPANKEHGDLACNTAMQLAKILKRNPMEIAEKLAERIRQNVAGSVLKDKVRSVEVLRPGFINFRLAPAAYHEVVADVLRRKEAYGSTGFGKGKKVLVEFVSANPTGPLTVAHARQAAVGDILVNILNFTGHHAEREFYVNDGGNQIRTLGLSVQLRCKKRKTERMERFCSR